MLSVRLVTAMTGGLVKVWVLLEFYRMKMPTFSVFQFCNKIIWSC
jgi:hypothetical protein